MTPSEKPRWPFYVAAGCLSIGCLFPLIFLVLGYLFKILLSPHR